jgi:hypothetical protein
MRPATHSTADPPVPVESVELREYINELRRRIEVGNDLLLAVSNDTIKLKEQLAGYKANLERVLLDLHWYQSKRKMD